MQHKRLQGLYKTKHQTWYEMDWKQTNEWESSVQTAVAIGTRCVISSKIENVSFYDCPLTRRELASNGIKRMRHICLN